MISHHRVIETNGGLCSSAAAPRSERWGDFDVEIVSVVVAADVKASIQRSALRVVVETPLPLAIVVEPPTSGSGGDGGGLPPRDNEGGPGDGDGGGDGRRKFFRFNVLAG